MKPAAPQTTLAPLAVHLTRRPLWHVKSVSDFLDLETCQIMKQIQDGSLRWAFNIGLGKHSTSPRIFSCCVVEKKLGPVPTVGATRNLNLAAVINLILPLRDVRSTELKQLLSCDQKHISKLKSCFKVTRPPQATDGPNAYTVFDRASVAAWLTQRRMI